MCPQFHFRNLQPPQDAVRRWAELEGKSATAREDLYQEKSGQLYCGAQNAALIILVELTATLAEILLYLT